MSLRCRQLSLNAKTNRRRLYLTAMPKSRNRSKKPQPNQHVQFVEPAHRFGADMGEEKFKGALGKFAKAKPE